MSHKIVVVNKYGKEGVSYEDVGIESYFGLNGYGMSNGAVRGEKALSHSFLLDTLRKVMGRTLTLLDSSIVDERQNKAMKDIVRGIISDEMEFAAEMAFDQKILLEVANAHTETLTDEELEATAVTLEDALGVK